MPLPGTLSAFVERQHVVELDLALVGLEVGLDHDRELDEAGGRHHLVGVEQERSSPVARCSTAMATLPLWALATRSWSARFERGGLRSEAPKDNEGAR